MRCILIRTSGRTGFVLFLEARHNNKARCARNPPKPWGIVCLPRNECNFVRKVPAVGQIYKYTRTKDRLLNGVAMAMTTMTKKKF